MADRCHRVLTPHSRHFADYTLVYPVISRRSGGLSIGVNLNPDGACNFNCVYCQVDLSQTTPGQSADLAVVGDELVSMLHSVADGGFWLHPAFADTPADQRRLSDIAFSGDGEPTAHPRFADAVDIVADARDEAGFGETRLVLITNATRLDQLPVRQGLANMAQRGGEVWAKLDAGRQRDLQRIDRPRAGVTVSRIVDNIALAGRAAPLVIQSMFLREHGEAPSDEHVAAYVDRLSELLERGCRIRLVQLYTVARQPRESHVSPLSCAELEGIAQRVRGVGLTAECFE